MSENIRAGIPELESARFITNDNPTSSECPLFRKKFSLKGEVASASLTVTARGLYEAYINGQRVGRFCFAPGWTSYSHRIQVQTYDVSTMLNAGKENNLDFLVGNGWHFGSIRRGNYEGLGERAVIGALCITYKDGTKDIISTDGSWNWTKSKILYSDIYHGEVFDANVTPTGWQPVTVSLVDSAEKLIPQEGEEVHEAEVVPALSLIITPKGERVIDFGQEVTGYVEFLTCGEIGTRIVLDHAEVLDASGNFYTENYRDAKSRVTYINNGEKKWYHPHFSFQGFRYIRLTEYPEKNLYIGDFHAIAVHSDMKRIGHFACSDQMVNRLYENVIWGQRGNFLDVPTDCPQRNERLGWTGDAQVFCRTALYNYKADKFFRKWLHDLALDQRADGAVPDVVPVLWNPSGAFAWGDAATVCPWQVYLASGDPAVLKDQFASMKKWVDYLRGKGNSPEEWGSGGQYGDWLGLDAAEGSYRGATSDTLLATAFLVYATDILIKAGRVLGLDMTEYETSRAHVAESFRKNFVGEDGLLTCDTQTAYVCALHFGLAPDPERYAAHLAEKIHANGDRLQTGFIGTAYIMDALTEYGYADVAYSLLLQKEFPSWLYCVRKGATTIWEHWDGIKPDGSMWSADMNSFNHYAYGAVASWMYGTIAGIRPDEVHPGYSNVLIAPIPDKRLDWAEASLETAFGTVKSGWKKTADGFEIQVTIPDGMTADITAGGVTEHVGAGNYTYCV